MMFRESRVRLYCAVTPSRGRPARAAAPAGGGARARAPQPLSSQGFVFVPVAFGAARAVPGHRTPARGRGADTSHAESCGGPLTRCE